MTFKGVEVDDIAWGREKAAKDSALRHPNTSGQAEEVPNSLIIQM